MGGEIIKPQVENPITSALQKVTGNTTGATSKGTLGNLLGGNNPWGLEQIGEGVGIAGDLFGMYNKYQAMQAAKTGINNQNKLSNYNMANNTNFVNGTINAFGSGQAKTVNQFGSGV